MGESPLFSWADQREWTGAAARAQIAENMAFDLDKVRQIAERVAGSSGLEVVEVEVCGAGKKQAAFAVVASKGAGAFELGAGFGVGA